MIEALDSIMPVGKGKGITVNQMIAKSGRSKEWVRKRLYALHAAGLLGNTRTFVVGIESYYVKSIPKKRTVKSGG
jgi:hypothetical protein